MLDILIFMRKGAAANFARNSNAVNASSFATRFARCRKMGI